MRFIDFIIYSYNSYNAEIIAVWQKEEFSEEQEICEYYYCNGPVIYKIDNILFYNDVEIDFVRDYKDYRFNELYSIIPKHKKYKSVKVNIPKNILCRQNISQKNFNLMDDYIKSSLYPYRRYNMTDYYIELAGFSRELGFDYYYEFFMDYAEKNFKPNKAFLRERYVRYLSSNDLDKALVYLEKIFEGNLQDNFDYMNMGYIFKMKGSFLKALEYYSKFSPQGPEHDFVRQDMIFCAENLQDNIKYFEMIDKLWKY